MTLLGTFSVQRAKETEITRVNLLYRDMSRSKIFNTLKMISVLAGVVLAVDESTNFIAKLAFCCLGKEIGSL